MLRSTYELIKTEMNKSKNPCTLNSVYETLSNSYTHDYNQFVYVFIIII